MQVLVVSERRLVLFTFVAIVAKMLRVRFLPRDASAERGYEIACRLSVCLSVCNV